MTKTKSKDHNLYMWFDMETNGGLLDSNHPITNIETASQVGWPLEVAFIITDSDFNNVTKPIYGMRADNYDYFESYVYVPHDVLKAMETLAPPAVQVMHRENHLWDGLKAVSPERTVQAVDSLMVHSIDQTLGEYSLNLREQGALSSWEEPNLVLAGSGVSHFDSRWIQRFFPHTWNELKGYNRETKPTVDIGVIRRFANAFTNQLPYTPVGPLEHRALSDVRAIINEATYYRDVMWDHYPTADRPKD